MRLMIPQSEGERIKNIIHTPPASELLFLFEKKLSRVPTKT
jgi:hypothetical protein